MALKSFEERQRDRYAVYATGIKPVLVRNGTNRPDGLGPDGAARVGDVRRSLPVPRPDRADRSRR